MQSHLCLLPDQLRIFIRYAQLLAVTLLALGVGVVLSSSGLAGSKESAEDLKTPLLPVATKSTPRAMAESEKHEYGPSYGHSSHISHSQSSSDASTQGSSSLLTSHANGLAARSTSARARSSSPSGYGLPAAQAGGENPPFVPYAGSNPNKKHLQDFGSSHPHNASASFLDRKASATRRPAVLLRMFRHDVWRVSRVVLPWYLWLLWTG